MQLARYWRRVTHRDPRAVALADRHYSRQKPGTPQFTRPGNKVVLLHLDDAGKALALWASQRPDPASGVVRWDGLDAWNCAMFRNEQRDVPASVLIQEAVAITKGAWPGPLPADGFWTTVDPRKVEPIRRRGEEVWGYCYFKAGWEVWPERTKRRGLVQLALPRAALERVEPMAVERSFYMPLFNGLAG